MADDLFSYDKAQCHYRPEQTVCETVFEFPVELLPSQSLNGIVR